MIRPCLQRARLPRLRRGLASPPTKPSSNIPSFAVFDRAVKHLQRDRAAADPAASRNYDYLKDEVADRLVERLLFVNRKFDTVMDLGSGAGHVAKSLCRPREEDNGVAPASRIKDYIAMDGSPLLLHRDANLEPTPYPGLNITRKVADEERLLEAVEENSLDAVISNLALHWVNDLPGTLIQVRRALKEDGLFLASMFAGDTLFELRTSLQLAEQERLGGISTRISPFTDVKDMGNLLTRAGLTLTTIDVEDIVVSYRSVPHLMSELRGMGESNAALQRLTGGIGRDVVMSADSIYRGLHGETEDGGIEATFSVLWMIGWRPGSGQTKPKERGSATVKMEDVLRDLGGKKK
ncbi:S-adenosyl-L-methionine-dependent methyltransferase [Saitoella complicata NRRL Y-17804]|uniref:S-adenosyl-L-methionine-dependent methyltransferase n=1 Tax=Saitoella complicata (strain BCRC 22490 / CBS 7301 / JCM 7358 / NBRC 10748 / NRRL Y-17804) TaxID=698492 RepID=UPI000866F471|nr:S-adenosyl-L-methionine-dependent methyltransferase [Saitoella complicata NRRL Y-17804]ODQ50938.1 S-adenosyl-L-methionine-dependent methyltransferase [Saitoella complicata NRRL Y-17804]